MKSKDKTDKKKMKAAIKPPVPPPRTPPLATTYPAYTPTYKPTKTKGAASDFWMTRYGGYSYTTYYPTQGRGGAKTFEMFKKRKKFANILNVISRSANIVDNADDVNADNKISVRWSDGKSTFSLKDNKVYLSPDVVNGDRNKDWTDSQKTDVLVGEALTESTMKRTVTTKAHKKIKAEKNRRTVHADEKHRLWYTAESISAETDVTSTYPGFKAYMAAKRDYYTDPDVYAALNEEITKPPTFKTAETVLRWSMLHPEAALNLGVYDEVIQGALERFRKCKKSIDRANTAIDTIKEFNKLWPDEGKDEGDEGEEGEGEGCDGDDDSDTIDPRYMGLPKEELDENVKNKSNEDLATIKPDEEGGKPSGSDSDASRAFEKATRIVQKGCSGIEAAKRELRPQIDNLKNSLKLQNETPAIAERGLLGGDVDEGSLYRLGFHAMGYEDNHIFERCEIISKPDMAIGLLVDESGSMGASDHGETRFKSARKIAIILASALDAIDGVQLCVLGHTADHRTYGDLILHEYCTPTHYDISSLLRIRAYSQNADGHAIKHMCKNMVDWYTKCPTKILIHISDGLPYAIDYHSYEAYSHMKEVNDRAALQGVRVIGICVGDDFDDNLCDAMYGEGNWVKVVDVASAHIPITNIIRSTLMKSCAL